MRKPPSIPPNRSPKNAETMFKGRVLGHPKKLGRRFCNFSSNKSEPVKRKKDFQRKPSSHKLGDRIKLLYQVVWNFTLFHKSQNLKFKNIGIALMTQLRNLQWWMVNGVPFSGRSNLAMDGPFNYTLAFSSILQNDFSILVHRIMIIIE